MNIFHSARHLTPEDFQTKFSTFGFHVANSQAPYYLKPDVAEGADNNFLNLRIHGWLEWLTPGLSDTYLMLFALEPGSETSNGAYRINRMIPPTAPSNILEIECVNITSQTPANQSGVQYFEVQTEGYHSVNGDVFEVTIGLNGTNKGRYKFTKKGIGNPPKRK